MLFALTADLLRTVENLVVVSGVATVGELMERAGIAVADEVQRRVPEGPVAVMCGPGNNGGDGWVAARALHRAGRIVRVLTLCDPAELPPDAAAAAGAARSAGVAWTPFTAEGAPLSRASVVVDALFGFGFHGPARDGWAQAIESVNASDAYVVSADMPSGVDPDTGVIAGPVVRADATVTFSAHKPGLLIFPGAAHAGEVVVADIGIPADMLEVPGAVELPEARDLRYLLPVSSPDDHKGARGRVAIVAGSRAYAGAAVLAAQGALRMGAGYVIVVVPECIADVMRVSLPNVLVRTVPGTVDGSLARVDALMKGVADADAVVAGPGLTSGPGVAEAMHALLAGVSMPLLLDADGLNVFSGDTAAFGGRSAPLVVTPHPGEAARLLGVSKREVQADRIAAASALAHCGAVCLLKGARTIIAGEDRHALVRAGNAGLARAGSGDVLSGMIGTLLAQGLGSFDAATLGAHIHGRAAEFGTAALTETCFTAADLQSFLPDAVREVMGE